MIAGREAVTSWMSIHAFQNATGRPQGTPLDRRRQP
jgi:hypothetical protein